jgi:hypothetical protein
MCSEYKTYLPKNFKYREVEKIEFTRGITRCTGRIRTKLSEKETGMEQKPK